MSNEECIPYSQSELKEAEYQRAIKFAAQEAAHKAAHKARTETKLSTAIEIARNLLKSKLDIKTIPLACGLDINQVREIAAQM